MATAQTVINPTLIFANGQLHNGEAVRRALATPAHIIAADGGAHLALDLGYSISLLIGDMDSISPPMLHQLEAQGVEVMRFSPEKDETDLQLALQEAARRGATWIRVIGALGGRFDQQLANIYLLNLPELAACDVRLVDGSQTIWMVSAGEHDIMGTVGDTVSLIPLGGAVRGITTIGFEYPLHNETLQLGPARGISNVIAAPQPRLIIGAGVLLVVHSIGRA